MRPCGFAVEGTEYEIDLSAKNAATFRKQLAHYIEHARKAGRAPAPGGRTAASRQRSGEIRAWAKQHGLTVSERGRIPASVVEQYEARARGADKPPLPQGTGTGCSRLARLTPGARTLPPMAADSVGLSAWH